MICALHRSTRKKGRVGLIPPGERGSSLHGTGAFGGRGLLPSSLPESLQTSGKVTPDTHPAGEPSWLQLGNAACRDFAS